MLQYIDFVLEPIVDFCLFFGVERRIVVPRNLSITTYVHLFKFWQMFSFYFIQAYLRSVHFLVTFISVKIELVLSAFITCFATKILPERDLLTSVVVKGYYCFLLFTESDRGFTSITEGLAGLI